MRMWVWVCPGDSTSVSTEAALERRWGRSADKKMAKGAFSAIKLLLRKRISASHVELLSP